MLRFPKGHAFPEFKFYSNGTLVRLHGGREIFIIENGSKRSIPNFDTFIAMKLDLNKVVSLSPDEFDAIPSGESMPMLNN